MRVPSAGAPASDGGLVLDEPEGEVDGDALVPEEVDPFIVRVGLQQVPEVTADAHLGRGDGGERRGRGGERFKPG